MTPEENLKQQQLRADVRQMLDDIKREHGVSLAAQRKTADGAAVFDFGAEEPLPSEFVFSEEEEPANEPQMRQEDVADGMSFVRSSYVLRFTGAGDRYTIRPSATPAAQDSASLVIPTPAPGPNVRVETDAEPVVVPTLQMPEDTVIIPVSRDSGLEAAEKTAESDRLLGRTIAPIESEAVPEVEEETAEPVAVATEEELPAEPIAETVVSAPAVSGVLPDPEPEYEPIPVVDEVVSRPALPAEKAEAEVTEQVPARREKRSKTSDFASMDTKSYFKDRFLDILLSVRIRLAAGAVALVISLVLEILTGLGYIVDNSPLLLRDLDAIFAVFATLLALPDFCRAVGALFRKQFRVELLPLALLFLCGAESALSLFGKTGGAVPLGVICGVYSLAVIGGMYAETTADFIGFKIVSLGVPMLAVRLDYTRHLDRENHALDGVADAYQSRTARVVRIGFLDGFFRRLSRRSREKRGVWALFAVTFAAALLVGVASYFVKGSGVGSALSVFFRLLLASLPLPAVLSRRVLYHAAQLEALHSDSTVVGESSYEEYARGDVLTFEEDELFAEDSIALRNFQLYQSDDIGYAFGRMAAFAGAVGGTLRRVFSGVDTGVAIPTVENPQTESGGVRGVIDGKTVLLGTRNYMADNGIQTPRDEDEKPTSGEAYFTLYAAEEGKVFARFHIGVALRPRFAALLPELREARLTALLLYTRDPFLTKDLLARLMPAEDGLPSLCPVSLGAEEHPLTSVRRMEAGVVTHGTKRSAMRMLLLCKRYAACLRKRNVPAWILSVVGLIFASLACFLIPEFPAYWIGIWQAICVGMTTILCKFVYFPKKSR